MGGLSTVDPELVGAVLEIWDECRFEGFDFYNTFGPKVLEHLFEIHPPSKKVFGIDDGERVFDARCQAHAKSLVLLVDGVFQMLTNAPEHMEQVFIQLGHKHAQAGVHPGLFPYMGQAIAHALQSFLEEPLNDDEVMAFGEVYGALSFEICQHIDITDEDADVDGLSEGMEGVSIGE